MLFCRAVPTLLHLVITVAVSSAVWLYPGTDISLQEAREIGEAARTEYLERISGLTDLRKRNDIYLDGLEKCNEIDRNWTVSVQQQAIRRGRPTDAVWLEKAGLNRFPSLFMTFNQKDMQTVMKSACAKYEKQLTCGQVFEGAAQTEKRIEDLKQMGEYKMMFDKECPEPAFVTRVYPCIGTNVEQWMKGCTELVDTYSLLRDNINARIESIYDGTIKKVKEINSEERKQSISLMQDAMSGIVRMEGTKCASFKKMRLCVLRNLLTQCGSESTRAFQTAISHGYLRQERGERLQLDFRVFNVQSHGYCQGL